MTVGVAIETLVMLRGKYQRMLEMRRVHDSCGCVDHDPREQMRALAAEFPGALREIDELPLSMIEQRIDQLGGVIDQRDDLAPWMLWMVDYHGHLRAALRIKRMGLSLDELDVALARVERDYVPARDEPPVDTFSNREALSAVLKPVEGRLNLWVFARIADRHSVGVDEIQNGLFPGRRSHR